MTSSFFQKPSSCFTGAMFILLAASALPSQATTLTQFSTDGSMMSGMRITASFLDGTSQSVFWGATGSESGGAFGNGWSLTQSGNTYPQSLNSLADYAWTLTNSGQSITSLVIDAIPGNTVFDNIFAPAVVTPGSAEGWYFQPISGVAPTSHAYSDPIDISAGDLFGKLSLYWPGGFTGVMQFIADTDSGTTDDPVKPRDPVASNTPPAAYFSAPTIYEGQSASTVAYATDPGEEAITFLLNGGNLGTDYTRSGLRQAAINFGYFADNGDHVYTVQARDENGNYSAPVTSVLQVLNLPPTITALDIPVIYEGQSASAYISAIDPGADAINFYLNGNYVGTDYNTLGTRAITTNLGYFADNTYIPYTAYAQDKDAAWSTPVSNGLTVLNVAPTLTSFDLSQSIIYEGQSVSAFLTATDPGADGQTFFINGINVGTDLQTSGTRSVATNLGIFSTPGTYTFTGQTQDKDTALSNVITRTLQVLNIGPTITQITQNVINKTNELFDFVVTAIDPGKKSDELTYEWDFDGDGVFDDFVGATGQWSFAEEGTYQVAVRVSDGNGGYAYGSFSVDSVDTVESVPEPASTLGVLVFGAGGAAALWKRKQQKRGKDDQSEA